MMYYIVDNSTFDGIYIEEFATEKEAIDWLNIRLSHPEHPDSIDHFRLIVGTEMTLDPVSRITRVGIGKPKEPVQPRGVK